MPYKKKKPIKLLATLLLRKFSLSESYSGLENIFIFIKLWYTCFSVNYNEGNKMFSKTCL